MNNEHTHIDRQKLVGSLTDGWTNKPPLEVVAEAAGTVYYTSYQRNLLCLAVEHDRGKAHSQGRSENLVLLVDFSFTVVSLPCGPSIKE